MTAQGKALVSFIVGASCGFFDQKRNPGVLDEIRRSKADMLLVAMGNPRQEVWLAENFADMNCQLGIGVGALFDFLAGELARAPPFLYACCASNGSIG